MADSEPKGPLATTNSNRNAKANTPPGDTGDLHKDQGRIWVFTWNEIINGAIQFISLVAALTFGVWAVKSFNASQHANSLAEKANSLAVNANSLAESANAYSRNGWKQSLIANQLALLALCISDEAIRITSDCATVVATISIPSIVAALELTPPIIATTTSAISDTTAITTSFAISTTTTTTTTTTDTSSFAISTSTPTKSSFAISISITTPSITSFAIPTATSSIAIPPPLRHQVFKFRFRGGHWSRRGSPWYFGCSPHPNCGLQEGTFA